MPDLGLYPACGAGQEADQVAGSNPALEVMYPLFYFAVLRLKIRDGGKVRNKAVYLAPGIDATGF